MKILSTPINRRTIIKSGAAALGASQIFSPAILNYARGETPIKIGMHDPLTGTYAAEGDSEARGARMALAEVNAKGGILGRQVELVIEDEGANAGIAAQKAHKLIEQDKVDFLMGAVSSATALSVTQVAHAKGMLYMVTGGHTDPVTGTGCHWTTEGSFHGSCPVRSRHQASHLGANSVTAASGSLPKVSSSAIWSAP